MINVAVLYGGLSNEANISLETKESIVNSLDKNKYNIVEVLVTNDKKWITPLLNEKIDIAILALHGGIGENGSIQGLLESMNIPYLGSKVLGSAIGMNKCITKQLLDYNEIKTPKWIYLNHQEKFDISVIKNFDYPFIIKPNDDGSSYDTFLVHTEEECVNAINNLLSNNKDIIIEEYIEGTEITVGVTEEDNKLKTLKILEIIPDNIFYDYSAKYESARTLINEKDFEEDLTNIINETAKKVFKVLNANNYARIDMIIKNNIPFVLEINTLPGMTSHSLMPKSLDISIGEFFDEQIAKILR